MLDFTKKIPHYHEYSDTWHILVPMIGFKIFGKRFYGDFSIYFVVVHERYSYNYSADWYYFPFPTPATTFGFTVP